MDKLEPSRVERHKRVSEGFSPYGGRPRHRTQDRRKENWKEKGSPGLRGEDEEDQLGTIKVSERSNVKDVAGDISHVMRQGEEPVLLSIGAKSCNQAVKAIAIARKYLTESDIDVAIMPHIRDGRRCAVCFLLKRCGLRRSFKHKVELAVSSKSIPSTIAGALAARVREGVASCLTGIGVDAIAKSIIAISTTRNYLEEDMMDIKACPEFIHVEKGGETLSAIRFNILVEDI